MEKMLDPGWAPLFQSLSWIIFILFLVIYFRRDIGLLRRELEARLQTGSPIKLGPLEFLEKKIGQVKEEVAGAKEDISVAKQFLLSMGPDMYRTLKMIVSGHFGLYEMAEWSGLQRELYYLRDIGYIEVHSIRSLPKKGDNLSDHVKATAIGSEFVRLRESLPPLKKS